MTDEYEVADENQVKILVDKINALNNKANVFLWACFHWAVTYEASQHASRI